jgi:hypothetical protein
MTATTQGLNKLHVHIRCLAAWKFEEGANERACGLDASSTGLALAHRQPRRSDDRRVVHWVLNDCRSGSGGTSAFGVAPIAMRRSYVDPGGMVVENPADAAGPSGFVDKAQLAPIPTASGSDFPYVRSAPRCGLVDGIFVPANDRILVHDHHGAAVRLDRTARLRLGSLIVPSLAPADASPLAVRSRR